MAEQLVFTLDPICLPDKVPEIRVWVRDEAITYRLDRQFHLDFNIFNGHNRFEIEFLNKGPKDTKVVDGKIVEDLAVVIKRIDYRGFDFLPYIDHIGTYHLDEQDNLISGTHGFMAFNGKYKFAFRGPLFILARDLPIHEQSRNKRTA